MANSKARQPFSNYCLKNPSNRRRPYIFENVPSGSSQTASFCVGGTFLPKTKEMRLNQMHIDNQPVTKPTFEPQRKESTREQHHHVKNRKFYGKFRRVKSVNLTRVIYKHNVLCCPT